MYLDLRDPLDHKDPVGAPLLDLRALKERVDRKVILDRKDHRESLEEEELKEEKDLQDPEVLKGKMAHQADRAPQDLWELQELQVPQEMQDLQENRGHWGHRVLLETRGIRVNGVTFSPQHRFRPSPGRFVSS